MRKVSAAVSNPRRTELKLEIVTVAIMLAGSLAAHAAAPAPGQADQNSVQACAQQGDKKNLCNWNGRTCALDVEKMDNEACHYDQSTVVDMDSDHKPMCFSVSRKHHIVFNSSQNRSFRVRRLVPITATNPQGQPCPAHPFGHHFDPNQIQFSGSADSQTPVRAAVGCKYKLEVQFQHEDPSFPRESDGHHYECRDPHLRIVN
jgi:hypothetical protein